MKRSAGPRTASASSSSLIAVSAVSIPGFISEDDDEQMLYRESAKQAGIIDKA